MSNLNPQEIAAQVKQAALDKQFMLCLVESNKGTVIPLAICNKLVEQYFGTNFKDGVYTGTTNIVKSYAKDHLANPKIPQDQKVIFTYGEGNNSPNWCVGGVVDIMPFKNYHNDDNPNKPKHIGFVQGVVVGEHDTTHQIFELENIELQAKEAIKTAESIRKFNEYAAIPELADVMRHLNLQPENF